MQHSRTVRGATGALIRFVCLLALVVAAVPLRASAPACASALPPKPAHRMDCCAGKAMACCRDAVPALKEFAKPFADCECQLRSRPATPPQEQKSTAPTYEIPPVAVRPPAAVSVSVPPSPDAPGIRGSDSGPPPQLSARAHRGRAPPRA